HHATDAFTESGGAGALSSAANSVVGAFSTLGVRVERQFALEDGMLLTASGGIGWRHAFADTPVAANSFAGGDSFTVAGAPIGGDAVALSGKLSLDATEELKMSL